MHSEVYEWFRQHGTNDRVAVLELGGLNVNGTIRDHYPNAEPYVALDIVAGKGVDVVADATSWVPDREYDIVISSSMFEHLQDWRAVLDTAYKACRSGGQLLVTCAGPGWKRHGWRGAQDPEGGEWYENIDPLDLAAALTGWDRVEVTMGGCYNADLGATARKP